MNYLVIGTKEFEEIKTLVEVLRSRIGKEIRYIDMNPELKQLSKGIYIKVAGTERGREEDDELK